MAVKSTLPGLEWMVAEAEAEAAAVHAGDSDNVKRLRARQDAQRRAQRERSNGTALTAGESQWLFKDARIIELPA